MSPFLNRIMGMCGLTVTNLRRMERFAETEDIFEGCDLLCQLLLLLEHN